MAINRPRGTKDLFGNDLLKSEELCSIIKEIFISYGYSEIQTPIFEHVNVFAENDTFELGSNKEFFYIEGKENILRPENTASVARALVENKLINKQVYYPLRYFYIGPYFRHERPQLGRFRQFTQLGIEKINSHSISDDIENLLLVKFLLKKLNLNLVLKLNFLGSNESKKEWNKALSIYFQKYKTQLSEISQRRIFENPLRILDDKEDSQKDFVKNAPKIYEYLTDQEKENLDQIKKIILDLNIEADWDSNLVRGIDYYTGLIYEWIDHKTGLTLIAGGRYNQLFDRFGFPNIPSLGLAIGLERIQMILESEKYSWKSHKKCVYLWSQAPINSKYHEWVFKWREYIQKNYPNNILCIASYENLNIDKHRKIAEKYATNKNPILIMWTGKELTEEEEEWEFSQYKNKIYAT